MQKSSPCETPSHFWYLGHAFFFLRDIWWLVADLTPLCHSRYSQANCGCKTRAKPSSKNIFPHRPPFTTHQTPVNRYQAATAQQAVVTNYQVFCHNKARNCYFKNPLPGVTCFTFFFQTCDCLTNLQPLIKFRPFQAAREHTRFCFYRFLLQTVSKLSPH